MQALPRGPSADRERMEWIMLDHGLLIRGRGEEEVVVGEDDPTFSLFSICFAVVFRSLFFVSFYFPTYQDWFTSSCCII
jgi:hypothetical protein